MKSSPCLILFLLLISLLSSCQTAEKGRALATSSPTADMLTATATVSSTDTLPAPTQTPIPTITNEPQTVEVCPPLRGYSAAELDKAIVNPYYPPPPGSDRPHQGVDLGVMDGATGMALSGDPVQAILSGVVRMVIGDRFPYGNALLVESALELDGDHDLLSPIPTKWAQVTPDPALTCPQSLDREFPGDARSIYILYAHLDRPPTAAAGSEVQCGETIGEIGMSGNALNPHVHLEARIGPAGAIFESMAHYDSSATDEEMGAYCTWRVSGIFQHFDPMTLLRQFPTSP